MGYRLGVDVGGTFTDLLLFNVQTGAFWRHKTPSTPHDSSEGILTGVTAVCDKAGIAPADIEFSLSADFNPTPLGADWLRLATEWYQQGLIPRSIWLQILKQNDIVPPDYNDEDGKEEISQDETVISPQAGKQDDLKSYVSPDMVNTNT